jgi:hypothetical protein
MPKNDLIGQELLEVVKLPEVKNLPDHTLSDEISTQEEIDKELAEGINNDPDEGVEEITAEQIREMKINKLKESKLGPKPKKNYGIAYKSERKRKNKQANKSRKANRR